MPVKAATELARMAPLAAGSIYLNFVSTYGAVVVTTLAMVYGVMQIVLRIMEFRRTRRKQRMEDERDSQRK